jgi:hypothetical protein
MNLGDEHGARGDDGGYGGTGQTRTRLPDSAGDVYGGARRGGRSSSRSLVTVVGVVVLLIAAIAFANRGDGDRDSPENGGTAKSGTTPTSPSGKNPVKSKVGGIPSGFAQSEQGAQSAASNYAVALGSTGMFQSARRHEIVDTVYAPAAADKLQSPMDEAYSDSFLGKLGLDADGKAPAGNTFVSRTVPLGTAIKQYSDSTAEVSVWCMGLIGMSGPNSTDPVHSTWKTWTFDLQWSNGDWKVTKDTQKDGPAPVPGDEAAASSDEISKAIEEYGGFTYAR